MHPSEKKMALFGRKHTHTSICTHALIHIKSISSAWISGHSWWCIDVLVYDRRRAGQDNGFAISTPTNKWGGLVGFQRCPFSFSNLVSGAGARTGTSVCLGSAISQQRRWLDMREKFSKSGPLLISEFLPCPPSSQLWIQFSGCTCCKGPPPHFNRSLSSPFFISPPLLSCLAPFGPSACK